MLITIEGIDGSGKSTQSKELYEYLSFRLGPGRVVWTREPGDWERGELVRELLLKGSLEHDHSELYLFMVDRCEHVCRLIIPSMRKGMVVLCERYTDSTLAYQVWGRKMPYERVAQLFKWSGFPDPDLTLWLDISPESASRRIMCRTGHDRIECGGIPFMRSVQKGYEELCKMFPERIKRIDAEKSFEAVTRSMIQTFDDFYSRSCSQSEDQRNE